jgi:hypothetical protein
MAIDEQNMIDDPEKREKLKKMIEGLDSKGMDRAMDAVMNYGGGSTYKMFGDTDPKDIDFTKEYKSDGATTVPKASLEKAGGGGGGKSNAIQWANLLIDSANKMGVEPPEKFWFDGDVYSLKTFEDPTYQTEKYTVDIPNPKYGLWESQYQAEQKRLKDLASQPSEPQGEYTVEYLEWLKKMGISEKFWADKETQENFEKRTGGKALSGGGKVQYNPVYLRWLSDNRILESEAGNAKLQRDFEMRFKGETAIKGGGDAEEYTRDFIDWANKMGFKVDDPRAAVEYERKTGLKAKAKAEPQVQYTKDYIKWLIGNGIKESDAANRDHQAAYEKRTGQRAIVSEPSEPSKPQPTIDDWLRDNPAPAQTFTRTGTRQVETGEEYVLKGADQGYGLTMEKF